MIIDAHAHIYEYLRPYGPWGEGRAIGKGKIRWPDGIEMQFFPPEYGDTGFKVASLLQVMEENKVDKAVFGHIHGAAYFPLKTEKRGVEYILTACDKIGFSLVKIY